ncbi:MAG: hypothetical protein ACRCYP_03730 [Alphaproteobacteria bacterium]
MILPRGREYFSDEELVGIRTARDIIEQHIAQNNRLQLQIQRKRVAAQMAQEGQQWSLH